MTGRNAFLDEYIFYMHDWQSETTDSAGWDWGLTNQEKESIIKPVLRAQARHPGGDASAATKKGKKMKAAKRTAAAALALTLAASSAPGAWAYSLPYTDVDEYHWAYEDILYVSQWDILDGRTETAFCPDEPLTRAEYVETLAGLAHAGLDRYPGSEFADVKETDPYAAAANWAFRQGIVNGVGEGNFDPEGAITREQMATMSDRFYQNLGIHYGGEIDEIPYTDKASIHDWALEAVRAMYTSGIMKGREDGSFDPQANVTRAETAAIARRIYLDVEDY